MNELDAFERSVKASLEPFEVPYNSADWSDLERQLDQGNKPAWQIPAALYALLLGGTLALGTTTYLLVSEQPVHGSGEVSMTVGVHRNGDGPDVLSEAATEAGFSNDQSNDIQDVTPNVEQGARLPARSDVTRKADPNNGRNAVRGNVSTVVTEEKPSGDPKEAGEKAIRSSITEGCPGTTVDFAMNNLPEDGIFLWNFGDGSFSNKPTPTHTYTKSGKFEVTLSHSSQAGGNIRNKPASDLIVIHEAPKASFQFLERRYENTVPSVHFENRSVGGSKYVWDFGDGSTSEVPHPDHVYKKQGTYTVTLTVHNANGCEDRMERTVRIDEDYDLMAPKAFSPNADGVADTFIPEALKNLGVRFQLSVFDAQTGTLLYETTDPARPWNGRVGNKGEPCQAGEYLWMVEMKDGDKLGGTYNGSVALVR